MEHVHEHTAIALERAGLTDAFPIQEEVIPIASFGGELLVKAPTGSGKTLAYGLPIIHQLERGSRFPEAVILVPTRELARQVADELTPIAWAKQLRCAAVFGGAGSAKQAKNAAGSPIIVATPGRLLDFMHEKKIDLRAVEILVLDEADRMLDLGFQPEVDEIVAQMPQRRQTMCFSATLGAKVQRLAGEYMNAPRTIENSAAPVDAADVVHELCATTLHAKVDTVLALLDDPMRDQAIVFVRTQQGATNLTEALRDHGHRATSIHGGMAQHERLKEYRHMQRDHCDVLVATDVFARGMDLDRVTHVINYELPDDADAYLHRAGRTGRAGRAGVVLTLVAQKQRPKVEGLLAELELPRRMLQDMRPAPEGRFEKVAPADRYRGGERTEQEFEERPEPKPLPKVASEAKNARRSDRHRAPRDGGRPGEGTVTGYNDGKGFGFIRQSAGGPDVFFHRSTVKGSDIPRLRPGLRVTYDVAPSKPGEKVRATRVTVAPRTSKPMDASAPLPKPRPAYKGNRPPKAGASGGNSRATSGSRASRPTRGGR
jgi:superfamily II DNA/RNA helicase